MLKPSPYEVFGAPAVNDLSHVLASPSPNEGLADLLKRANPKVNLGDYCLGAITWDKAAGKPTTARMCDAFMIDCWTWDRRWTALGRVFTKATLFATLWDDPVDDENFRVGFLIKMPASPPYDPKAPKRGCYELAVRFIDPQAWHSDSSSAPTGARIITPGPSSFRMDETHCRFLPYLVETIAS